MVRGKEPKTAAYAKARRANEGTVPNRTEIEVVMYAGFADQKTPVGQTTCAPEVARGMLMRLLGETIAANEQILVFPRHSRRLLKVVTGATGTDMLHTSFRASGKSRDAMNALTSLALRYCTSNRYSLLLTT